MNTRLLVNTLQGVTLIPSSTIQQNGQTSFVYVIQDSIAHRKTIKPGVTDAGITQVDGINPGTFWPVAVSISCRRIPQSLSRTTRIPRTKIPKARRTTRTLIRRARTRIRPSQPPQVGAAPSESISSVYSAASGDVFADGCNHAHRLVLPGTSQLPVSALPEVDYPTIQGVTFIRG